MLISTVWLGAIGFLDDYIKVFKKDKKGLAGKFKVLGQIGLGLIVGSVLYFNEHVVVREKKQFALQLPGITIIHWLMIFKVRKECCFNYQYQINKTTIPFSRIMNLIMQHCWDGWEMDIKILHGLFLFLL